MNTLFITIYYIISIKVAALHLALAYYLVEQHGYAGRRGVATTLDVVVETLVGQVEVLLYGVDNAHIGLMQKVVVYVVGGEAGRLDGVGYVALGRSDGHAEHLATFKLHGHVGVDAGACLERGGLAGQTIVDHVGHGGRGEPAGQHGLAFAEHHGTGRVAEEHAGLALCPVDHAGHFLGTYI